MRVAMQANRQRIPPLFIITLIFISASLIALAAYNRVNSFAPTDRKPALEELTPQKIVEFGNFQETVTVGLYITNFEKFDILNNQFECAGTIWFEFNSDAISLATLEKFSFEAGEILYRSPAETQLIDNKILARYNIRIRFSSPLDFTDFPLDDHRIFITLIHQFITPHEIIFEASKNNFKVKAPISGWKLINKAVHPGFGIAQLNTENGNKNILYPKVIFEMDYLRISIRYLFSIMLPLLLIFYLIHFAFAIGANESVGLTVGGVTAILAYRFVIENLTPKTADFMISDYLFLLFLGASFFIFFFNLINIFAIKTPLLVQQSILILLNVIVTGLTIYLFWLKS